jgi:haloalkane dehalogenase
MMSHPTWLDREAYPFTWHTLRLPPGNLHYVDEGAGPAIVLVHGNPTWSFLYRDVIRALAPTHRCVAPDHLGFGLSDKPASWSYAPADHARNFASLIETLGLTEITLVMHDWGGPIGLWYAVHHPAKIRAIVVLNSWMWPVNRDPYYWILGTLARSPVGRWLYLQMNIFARWVMSLGFGSWHLPDNIHAQYLHPTSDRCARYATWRLSSEVLASTSWLASLWAKRAALRDIPMRIVWGMQDWAFRKKELERWETAYPTAIVRPAPTVGHFVPEEAPTLLADAILESE